MLYREITARCSEMHTKHINKLCGQNVELLNVKLGYKGLQYTKSSAPFLWYINTSHHFTFFIWRSLSLRQPTFSNRDTGQCRRCLNPKSFISLPVTTALSPAAPLLSA